MTYTFRNDTRVEPLVDGMIDIIRTNLIAHTRLVSDASQGDRSIYVDNTARFEKGEQIVIMDDEATFDEDSGAFSGVEFNTVAADIVSTHEIRVEKPLLKGYPMSKKARIQKAIKNSVLYPKDVYYGDRGFVTWDYVAICVEPEALGGEWMATGALRSNEYRISLLVYVKTAGSGDAEAEDLAMRVVQGYADAIYRLFLGNLHVDLVVDEAPLRADAVPGQNFVYIGSNVADKWPPDECNYYEVQDNYNADQDLHILSPNPASSSESSITSGGVSLSSPSSSSSSVLSPSSASSHSSSLSSSLSSQSQGTSSSSTGTSLSSSSLSWASSSSSSSFSRSFSSGSSSQSSMGGDQHRILLDYPLRHTYRISDKAVLRRKARFFYDSMIDDVQYGMVQKGAHFFKAAKLGWFGKETVHVKFPQPGKGGKVY